MPGRNIICIYYIYIYHCICISIITGVACVCQCLPGHGKVTRKHGDRMDPLSRRLRGNLQSGSGKSLIKISISRWFSHRNNEGFSDLLRSRRNVRHATSEASARDCPICQPSWMKVPQIKIPLEVLGMGLGQNFKGQEKQTVLMCKPKNNSNLISLDPGLNYADFRPIVQPFVAKSKHNKMWICLKIGYIPNEIAT